MLTDSQALSPLMVGLVANALGYAAPLLFFLPLRRLIAVSYFDDWLWAYASLAVASLLAIPYWLASPAWAMVMTLFGAAGCMWLLRLPDHLAGRKPPDARLLVLGAAVVAVSWAFIVAFPGPPSVVQNTPVIVVMAATKVAVACSFWRHADKFLGASWRWLTAGFLLDGLWLLTLVPLTSWDYTWLSLLLAGALHAGLGVGLALVLVVNAGTLLREPQAARTRQERFAADLVATVSHELRTPLTVLKMSAWMLEESLRGEGMETRRALAGDMLAATDRLSHFLDRLLDLAQHEHGQVPYTLEPGCLQELAQEVSADMAPLYDDAGVVLRGPEGPPTPALFDAELLRQVLTNLLGNALKFTPRGGTVVCDVRPTERGSLLTVRDDGPGIPATDLARIFTRFYRGSHGKKGLGLGLALCKVIVEDGHQGRLWVESTPGHGAAFHVCLPPLPSPAETPR